MRTSAPVPPSLLLPVILLYATLLASAVVIARIVVRYDLYDREPVFMLVLGAALGAGAMWTAGQVQSVLFGALGASGWIISDTTVSFAAASTEELAKLAVAAVILVFFPTRFNDPLDGLIYGSMAGLGAALEESMAVLRDSQVSILPRGEIIRLSGHLIMGAITSAGLGAVLMRSHGFSRRRILAWGVSLPIAGFLLHLAWDINAFAMRRAPADKLPFHTATAMVLMIAGLAGFRVLAGVGARWSRTALGVCDQPRRATPAS